jgi:hypothetical protein
MQLRKPQPAPAENRVSGTYKTTRDSGLDYAYAVTWELTDLGLAWTAEVKRDGKPAGAPSALVGINPGGVNEGFDPAAYFHRIIALYIENRWHVD